MLQKGPEKGAADRLNSVVFPGVAPLASQGARSESKETKLLPEVGQTWARSAPERPRESAADRLHSVVLRGRVRGEVVSKRVFPKRVVFDTPLKRNCCFEVTLGGPRKSFKFFKSFKPFKPLIGYAN